jgi:hypothetical protein
MTNVDTHILFPGSVQTLVLMRFGCVILKTLSDHNLFISYLSLRSFYRNMSQGNERSDGWSSF